MLHDLFYYDWHVPGDGSHRLHGYRHPGFALKNAKALFTLSEMEENKIISVVQKGNKFVYAVNIHDVEVDVTIECKGYTSFIHDGKVVSNKLHFDSYESKILYLSNEQVEEKKENNKLYLGNNFKLIGSPLNYLTLDYLSYSKDGINYNDGANIVMQEFIIYLIMLQ